MKDPKQPCSHYTTIYLISHYSINVNVSQLLALHKWKAEEIPPMCVVVSSSGFRHLFFRVEKK